MRKLFMFLAAIVFSSILWGQGASTYSFSSSNGVYTPITGGTILRTGVSDMDDWSSSAVTIPSFTFAGTAYTTAFVSSNGFITLGGTAPSTTEYTAISATAGSGKTICAFSADLNKADTSSKICWQHIGDTIVFQWSNVRRYGKSESFDIQMRLNTTTHQIQFVYNLITGPGATTDKQPQVGIRSSSSSYKNLKIESGSESWGSPLMGTSSSNTCRFTSDSPSKTFTSGLTYTFDEPLPCASPTSQPTNLTFSTITAKSVNGSFVLSAADNYLIVRSTSNTPSALPVDNVIYTSGNTIGTDTVVTYTSSNTFASTGLLPLTQYYYFIYAANDICAGGPKYLTNSPLTANVTTVFEEPATFTAQGIGLTEVALTATPNATGQNIIVAWESSNTFGTPTGSYAIGDSISGGGKVIYIGPASGLTNHTGLIQGTKYYYKAWSFSGTTYSSTGKTANAKTLPPPYTLPVMENFTSTIELPDGWTIWNSGTSTGSWTASTGGVSNGCAYSGYYGPIWLISNKITVPANGSIDIKFSQKNTYLNDYIKHSLYYSTTGAKDVNSWIPINANIGVAPTTWTTTQKYIVNNYIGTTIYLAFKYEGNNADGWYIDDLQVEESPLCQQPLTQSVDSISSTSARLKWTSVPSILEWNIEYGPQGFTPGAGTIVNNVTTPSYPLAGLNQSTSYSFYVQSVCAGNQVSAWTGPFTFTTYQQPLIIPTTIDFESSNGGFVLVNGTQTNQWYVGSAVANGGMNSIYVSNDNGATNSYSITNSSTVHAYRDIEFPTGNQAFTLSFDWKAKGESCCDHLKVYLVDPSVSPVAGTELPASNQVGLTYNNDTIWKTANIVLPGSLLSTVKKLVFTWRNDGSGGTQSPVAIDNISIQTLQCPPINTISSENTTHNAATINWTSYGTETSWNIEYGVQGFTQGTGTVVNANSRPYTITNLNASTAYQVYIQANCGSGSSSAWVGPFAFTTDCAPATVFPTMEDFATVPPTCWSQKQGLLTANSVLTPVTYGWFVNSFGYTGSPSATIEIYGTYKKNWLISPAFNLAGTNPMQVEFDVALTEYYSSSDADTNGTDDRFVLLASTDNGTTWSNANILREWNNTAAAQYRLNNIPKTGTHVIVALPAYTGNVRFALYGESTVSNADNYLYIDNFSVSEVPSCQKPTNLTLVSNTHNQAVLNWNTGMNETQWNIEYGPQGFTQGAGTMVNNITTKPYTLTGLNPATAYSVYVQANCGTGNTSLWIGPVSFTTNAAPNLNYPFVEDFETTPNNNWTIVNGSQTNKWFIGSASAYAGQQAAYISNDNGTSNTYTLGTSSVTHIYRDFEFPANASHVYIRFNWKANGEFGSTIYDYLRVSMCNLDQTPVAGSLSNLSFITPQLGDTTDWKELNLNIDTLAGKTKRLVFTWRNDDSGGIQPPASIDNIIVSLTPPVQIYNVVGGGSYCQMTIPSGVQVKLDSSQVGYDYQLFRNGNAQGNPVAGTGNALTWNNVLSGNYTVQAISGTSFIPMNGTAYVYENSAQHVTASLLNPVTSACQGASVTFTANGINGGTTPSYQWIVNGANVGTNNYQYSYTPANNDTIKCIVTSSLTCNDGPATSALHIITVNPNVTATLAITADSTTIHAGSQVTFTATATHAGSAPVYEWKVNNQGAGTNNATFAYNPLNNDAVYCKLTSNESCVSNSPVTSNTITINATLSINENGQLGLKIYTANSQLIVLNEGNGIIRDIAIMNLLGQQVFHKSVNTVNAENIALNLIPSTYVVRVTTDKGIVTQKILIH
jgi:hypothetical protein